MDVLEFFWQSIRSAAITDIIDVLIVSYLLYMLIKLIKDTNAEKLIKGVFLLVVVMQVSEWMRLNTIHFILKNAMQMGLLAIIILFQPELRKMLEQMGKSSISSLIEKDEELSETQNTIIQVVEACSSMSGTRTGALIIFEKNDRIQDIAKTGTFIESKVSSELVKNIFYPKAPLHDGAMIIREGRILSAACVLPLSAKQTLSRDLGTRHRAGVGMSEHCDAVCVMVSEETGSISVAIGGMLKRHLAPQTLEKLLMTNLIPEPSEQDKKVGIFSRWKARKNK